MNFKDNKRTNEYEYILFITFVVVVVAIVVYYHSNNSNNNQSNVQHNSNIETNRHIDRYSDLNVNRVTDIYYRYNCISKLTMNIL